MPKFNTDQHFQLAQITGMFPSLNNNYTSQIAWLGKAKFKQLRNILWVKYQFFNGGKKRKSSTP